MENHQIVKILAVVIVVVMAFSMLAAGFLYANNGSSNSDSTNPADVLPTPSVTPFTYDVSFDGNALKELSTIKVATYTTNADKALIDSAVLKVDGVLKVNSQFKKTATDANDWIYIADVSLKKNSDAVAISANIFDVNYFEQSRKTDFSAAKYITVSAPSSVMLHNSDLNMDRNFSFESQTLTAYASLATTAGDELLIGGTVTVSGTTITSLLLSEQLNKTKQPKFDLNQLVIDSNSSAKDNSVTIDVNKPSADLNN